MSTTQKSENPKSLAEWATDPLVMVAIVIIGLCAGWFSLQDSRIRDAQRYEIHAGSFTTYFTDKVTTQNGYVNFVDALSENSISLPIKSVGSIVDRENRQK